jgi:hypothetical protein
MSSLINTFNLFNVAGSNGAIKFYEYNSTNATYDENNPTNQILFDNSGDLIIDSSKDIILNICTDSYFSFRYNDTSLLNLKNSSGNAVIYNGTENSDIIFKEIDSGNEIMRIDGSAESLLIATNKKIEFTDGNKNITSNGTDLIINTDGPLQYNSNSTSTFSVTGDLIMDVSGDIIFDADGDNITMKAGGTNNLDFIQSNSGDWNIKNTTQDKDIIFNVNDNSSDTEVMRIDGSESKIGINTSNPQKKLEILDNTDSQLRLSHDSSNYIDFRANVDSSNKTYLEITSPGSSSYIKFTDGNGVSFISSSNTIPFFSVGSNNSSGSLPDSPTNISNGFRFLYNTSNDFKIQRNHNNSTANDIITFKQNTGNIGIGTTSPSTKLEVVGEVKASTFTDGNLKLYSGTINNVNYIQSQVASFTNLYSNITNLVGFFSKSITDGNTSVICRDDNVGSISIIIDNKNTINFTKQSNTSRLMLISPDNNNKFTLGVHDNGSMYNGDSFIWSETGSLSFGANNTEIMKLIYNSGTKSVVIGSTLSYSDHSLVVDGKIISVGNSSGLHLTRRDNNQLAWTTYSPQGDYRILSEVGSANMGNIISIQNDGRVGIGVNLSYEKLTVVGSISGSFTDGIASLTNGELILSNISAKTLTDKITTITDNSITNNKLLGADILKLSSSSKDLYTPTYMTSTDSNFSNYFDGNTTYDIPYSNDKTYNSITTLYINYTYPNNANDYSGLVYTTGTYKFGIQVHPKVGDGKFIPFVDTESPYNDWYFADYLGTFSGSFPTNQEKGVNYKVIVEYDYSYSGSITITTYFKNDNNIYSWTINDNNFPKMVIGDSNNSLSLGSSEKILLGRQDPASANYFRGTISDFRIIEKKLTEREREEIFYGYDNVFFNNDIFLNENDNINLRFNNYQMFITKNDSSNQNPPLVLRTEQSLTSYMGILGTTPYLNVSRTDNNPSFLIDGPHYNYGFGSITFKLTKGGNHNEIAKRRYDITQDGKHIWYNEDEKQILLLKKEINSPSTNTAIYIGGDTAISSPETDRYLRLNQTNVQLSANSSNLLTFDATNYYFNNGNVGINTNSPDRKLEIIDNTNPQLRLTHTNNSKYVDFIGYYNNDTSATALGISTTDSNSFIKYYDNNSNNIASFISSGRNNSIPFLAIGNNYGGNPDKPTDIYNGFRFYYYNQNSENYLSLRKNINNTNPGFLLDIHYNKGYMILHNFYNTNSNDQYGDLIIKQRNNSTAINKGGFRLFNPYTNKTWAIISIETSLTFFINGTPKGYIYDDSNKDIQNNFTGQHRSFINEYTLDELQNYEGLIVCADKNNYTLMSGSLSSGLDAITINEALPDISLCTKENDKTCFGVFSNIEDSESRIDKYGNYVSIYEKENGDTRPYINSIGEGCIWVSNKNGPLESGDYITTSSIPGYGMKQNDNLQHNYTVAKITMNCDFIQTQVNQREVLKEEIQVEETKEIIVKDENGDIIYDTDENGYKIERKETITETITKQVNILDNKGFVQFVETDKMINKYRMRYLLPNGIQITEEEYNTKISNNEEVYKAVFVGCTYHCG